MVSTGPSAVRQSVMVLAIGFALYAQLAVHRSSTDTAAWWLLAVAALLAAIVAGERAAAPGASVPRPATAPGAATRIALGALAVAAIAVTTYLSAARPLPVLALTCWLAAPVVASAALQGWQIAPARRAAVAWSRGELAVLVALLVLAALARTLWLRTLPRAIFGDEPRVAMYLHDAYERGAMPSFFSMGWNTWPAIGLAVQGLFTPLLGIHMWTLRLSSALMGTLGVLAVYLLARELYTPRAALFAACLFAICRTAIDFSRLGITHAQVLFLEPLAFFFLWRALNSGRAVSYLWAGVATAWCLYTYNAGQLVPPLVFGWLVLGALTRPARLRTHWRGVALLLAAFALTLFPYFFYFTDHLGFGPNWEQWTIMARNRQTLSQVLDVWHAHGFAPAWEILSHQIWTTWLGFGVLPGGGYVLGYRNGGMLDDVSAALFALGLAMSIRRLRRGGDAFVFYWWLGTVIFGGIATIDPPSFVRMVGLLPALALLAALPLEWLASTAAHGIRQLVPVAIAGALVLGATWSNYRTYFVDFAATQADYMSELARYFETLPPDYRGALLGVDHFLQFRGELFLIEFPDRWQDVAEPAHFLPLHAPITAPLALVLGPTQTTLSDELRTLYPGAQVSDVTGVPDAPPLFRAVVLMPDEVRARTGLALAAQRRDGAAAGGVTADPFDEHVETPADAVRLQWSGSIYWPTDRPLPVTVNAAQPTTVTFGDGGAIRADGTQPATAMITMPLGWQPVRIEETVGPQRRLAIALGGAGTSRALTRWDFRPQAAREGLTATYVRGDGATLHAVDPQLDAFAVEDRFPLDSELLVRMPFTAAWRGALRIDQPGAYDFEATGSGPFEVRLDGDTLFAAKPDVPEQPVLAQVQRTLTAGLHPIEVDFDSTKPSHTTRRLFQLFWTPPGGTKQLIPPGNFVPASG